MKNSGLGRVLQVRVPHDMADDLKLIASAHEASRSVLITGVLERFLNAHQLMIYTLRQSPDYQKLLDEDFRASQYHVDQLPSLFRQIQFAKPSKKSTTH